MPFARCLFHCTLPIPSIPRTVIYLNRTNKPDKFRKVESSSKKQVKKNTAVEVDVDADRVELQVVLESGLFSLVDVDLSLRYIGRRDGGGSIHLIANTKASPICSRSRDGEPGPMADPIMESTSVQYRAPGLSGKFVGRSPRPWHDVGRPVL